MVFTLRQCLEEAQSRPFTGRVADISVNEDSIHLRLTQIRRALVAHDALCKELANVDHPMPVNSFITAIEKASSLGLITISEEGWLRFFNKQANDAKHHGLP
jgi:hypothetical protein